MSFFEKHDDVLKLEMFLLYIGLFMKKFNSFWIFDPKEDTMVEA